MILMHYISIFLGRKSFFWTFDGYISYKKHFKHEYDARKILYILRWPYINLKTFPKEGCYTTFKLWYLGGEYSRNMLHGSYFKIGLYKMMDWDRYNGGWKSFIKKKIPVLLQYFVYFLFCFFFSFFDLALICEPFLNPWIGWIMCNRCHTFAIIL